MAGIRQPAVAGTFYPAFGPALKQAVDRCLPASPPNAAIPKALIVPHAGYAYSGPVAGTAYALLVPGRTAIRRVVLIGPSHRVPFEGIGTSRATSFRTPLGDVPLDTRSVDLALSLPSVRVMDAVHAPEHCLEVQLPFLQTVLAGFSIVPLLTGRTSPSEVAHVLQSLWNGSETLVVVSTDLTHYLPYGEAKARDARTAGAILALDPSGIGTDDACGSTPLRGLLLTARRLGLRIQQLDLRSSGDTAGQHDAVVGYGSFALFA